MRAVAACEYHVRLASARAVIEIVIVTPAVNYTRPDWRTPAVVLLPMPTLTLTRVGLALRGFLIAFFRTGAFVHFATWADRSS